jgi:hypothetical protein
MANNEKGNAQQMKTKVGKGKRKDEKVQQDMHKAHQQTLHENNKTQRYDPKRKANAML